MKADLKLPTLSKWRVSAIRIIVEILKRIRVSNLPYETYSSDIRAYI